MPLHLPLYISIRQPIRMSQDKYTKKGNCHKAKLSLNNVIVYYKVWSIIKRENITRGMYDAVSKVFSGCCPISVSVSTVLWPVGKIHFGLFCWRFILDVLLLQYLDWPLRGGGRGEEIGVSLITSPVSSCYNASLVQISIKLKLTALVLFWRFGMINWAANTTRVAINFYT